MLSSCSTSITSAASDSVAPSGLWLAGLSSEGVKLNRRQVAIDGTLARCGGNPGLWRQGWWDCGADVCRPTLPSLSGDAQRQNAARAGPSQEPGPAPQRNSQPGAKDSRRKQENLELSWFPLHLHDGRIHPGKLHNRLLAPGVSLA